MCCFSPDSTESPAQVQREHAGDNGTDSVPVHGGTRDGSPDARVQASLQQQHQLWGTVYLWYGWTTVEKHGSGWSRSLAVFCVCSWGFYAWSTCELSGPSCFWNGRCQVTEALPCKEIGSTEHFSVALIHSCETCVTWMVVLCTCLKQIMILSGFRALMSKGLYPFIHRFVSVGLLLPCAISLKWGKKKTPVLALVCLVLT